MNLNYKNMIEQTLEFLSKKYNFSHSKHNILTYICEAKRYYSDWEEDGGILIIEYHPERSIANGRYYILHCLSVSLQGDINPMNLTGYSRCAEPIKK